MKKVRLGAPERLWYSSWRKAGFSTLLPYPKMMLIFSIALKKPAGVKVRIKLRLEIEDFTGAGLMRFFTEGRLFYYFTNKKLTSSQTSHAPLAPLLSYSAAMRTRTTMLSTVSSTRIDGISTRSNFFH